MTIRVVQITDIHLTAEPGSLLYGVDTAESLKNIIDAIAQLTLKPDMVIATGDLAEDGAMSTYERLQDLLAQLCIPVYVLPGNHDDVEKMRACLNRGNLSFTKSANVSDWGFVFVNSQVLGQSHGYLSAKEISELENNISKVGDCPILVAIHHTPSDVCPASECRLTNAEEFTALLNRHKNIKGVIAGHTHTANEFDTGSHIQFTTPSTFAYASHPVDLADLPSSHKLDGSLQGFRILDLFPEGSIKSEVRWL